MKFLIKVIKKFFELGVIDFFKFCTKRFKDIFFLDFLTTNLIDKNQEIKAPIILISQIQRSGGTLLSQLFDGHKEICAYPNELTIWRPKWKLKNLDKRFENLDNDYIKFFALKSEYKKESKSKWNKTYNFYFNLNAQKKIFNNYLIKKNGQRNILNAYFTSFFYSWLNYKDNLRKKKYVSIFIPRVNMENESLKYFFKHYPDGKFITIVRDPLDWLASALKHDPKSYSDFERALTLWKKSTISSMTLIKKKNVIGITFYDLIKNTEKTINKICKKIDITPDSILTTPTFNSEPILSDSSFKSVEGKIDKRTLNRKNNFKQKKFKKLLQKKNINILLKDCNKLYNHFYKLKKI